MHNPTAEDEGAEQRATSAAAGARAGAASNASRYDIHARDDPPDELNDEARVTTSEATVILVLSPAVACAV